MRSTAPFLAAAAFLFASSLGAGDARAVEVQLAGGAGGEASTWQGDGAAFASLKLGFRFRDLIAPYFLVRVGYGTVDDRMLTLLQVGGQLWARLGPVRPFVRLGLAHQHEESMAAMDHDPFGALFGVGDGIRHRFGFEGALGVDLPIHKKNAWELHALVEALVTGFPDPRGPGVYAGGTAGLGFNYTL